MARQEQINTNTENSPALTQISLNDWLACNKVWLLYAVFVLTSFGFAEFMLNPEIWWQHLLILFFSLWISGVVGAIDEPESDQDSFQPYP